MTRNKLLLIGGGGHCASIADAATRTKKYDEIGIVDKNSTLSLFGNIYTVGDDEDLPKLKQQGWKYAFVSVGSIGNTNLRQSLFNLIRDIGFIIPNIIDPSAVVSESTFLSSGIYIGKRAVVNARTVVEDCAIVNTAAVVEHDCHIGSFAHISPNATLCGGVYVGRNTHVGAGAVIKQCINIGTDSIIGIGSIVINDIGDNMKMVGNPAKSIVI